MLYSSGTEAEYGYYAASGYIYEVTGASECTREINGIGFYKKSTKYFECKKCDSGNDCNSNVKCTLVSSLENSCTDTTVGKLFNDQSKVKLCLGKIGNSSSFASLELGKAISGENYLVKHTKKENGNVFSYNTDANYYVVQSTADAIKLDSTFTTIEDYKCAETDGKIVTRMEDFCSANSSGKYYSCNSGVCTSKDQLPGIEGNDDNGEDKCISIGDNGACTIAKPTKCGDEFFTDPTASKVYIFKTKDQKDVVSDNVAGHYIKINYDSTKVNMNEKYTCESFSASITTETIFENQVSTSNTNFPLIHCQNNNENIMECKLSKAENGNYYADGETKKLLKYDGSVFERTEITNVDTGLYINKSDKTVVSCVKETGCEIGSAYLVKKCTENNFANFRLNEDKDNEITLCGNYNETSSKPIEFTDVGVPYIINTSSGKFPGVTSTGKIQVKISSDKILKQEDKEECTADMQIVYDGNNYSLCANVTQTGTEEVDSGEKNPDGTAIMVTKNVYSSVKIPFEENGGIFLMSSNGSKVISMGENKYEFVFTEGYYIDRKGGVSYGTTTTIYHCDGGSCTVVNSGAGLGDKPLANDYYINAENKYGSSAGNVIKCLKQTIGETDFVECTIDNGSGYYTNSQKELISCKSSKCEVLTENIEGTYYLNGNTPNENDKPVIECDDTPNCAVITPSADYNNYINADKKMSIIKCTRSGESPNYSYSCSELDAEKYSYYITKQTNANYIECNIEECTTGSSDGNYINNMIPGEIITCNGGICSSNTGYNYYVDTIYEGYGLIQCFGNPNNPCVKVTGLPRKVYITGNNSGLNPDANLIKCINNSCEIGSDQRKIFLNGGSDRSSHPLIKYEKYYVGEDERNSWITIAASANTVYINGNKETDDYGVIFCTDAVNCNEVSDTKNKKFINPSSKDSKFLISCNISNECSEGTIDNLTAVGQSHAYLFNPNTGVVLEDNTINGKLVVCSKISEGEPATEKIECQLKTSGYLSYYVNGAKAKSIIQNINNVLNIENNIDKKGYYVNSSDNVVVCDGSNCSTYTQVDCEANSVGSLKSQNLCVGYDENAITVSTSTNGKYIIDAKKFAGNNNGKMLITINNKMVFQSQPSVTEYYLVSNTSFGMVKSAGSTGDLYYCDSTKCDILKKEGSFANSDVNTVNTFPTIKCEQDQTSQTGYKCYGVQKSNSDVYCLSSTNNLYMCNASKNCEDVNSTSETTCVKQTVKTGLYLSVINNNYLLNCNANSNTCSKKTDLEETYYLSEDLSNPLIQCIKTLNERRCFYVTPEDGYYRNIDKKLIECSNKVCSIPDNNCSGYYKSAEIGKVLTYCEGSSCTVDSKPAAGWYMNGKSNGNNLIKCTSQSSGVNCQEIKIQTDGALLSALAEDKLITCNKGICGVQRISETGYFVNGENNQLIYCKESVCLNVEVKGKGWYKPTDNQSLIGCSKSKICVKYVIENLAKGFYINSDPNTSLSEPLIEVDEIISTRRAENKGWYINADSTAENSEKIIACSSESSCITKSILATACTSQNKGEFTLFYGGIRWCNGVNAVILPSQNYDIIFTSYTKSGFVPGVNLPEGKRESFIRLKICKDKVIQSIINGYEYKEGKLYFCYNNANGHCMSESIKNGYYFDHKNLKITKCEGMICEEYSNINDNYMKSCDESNVRIDKSKREIQICKDQDENNRNVSNFEKLNGINEVYSLKSDLQNKFPGSSKRYVLADVSKYNVLFKENIDEINECPKENASSETEIFCIKEGKLYKKSNISSQITTSGLQISKKSSKNQKINYDYDTNDGYFEYSYDDSDIDNKINILTKVYINKIRYKLECIVGSTCVKKDIADAPIIGFDLTEDNVLRQIRSNSTNTKEVVDSKILPGKYIKKGGGVYECDRNGFCSVSYNSNIQLAPDGVNIKVTVNGMTYTSSGLKSKFIFNAIGKNHRKRNGANNISYGEVSKLTHVTFTSDEDSKNIFVDSNNYMVTNGDEEIVKGYSCINGNCREIKCKNDEYYINTVQSEGSESWKNAVIHCKLDTSRNKNIFEAIHCSEEIGNQIFENAAAENENDVLIVCDSLSCQTQSSSNTNGLPTCKSSEGNQNLPDITNKACVRADNSVILLEGQRCILNKIIYKTDNGNCRRDDNDSNGKGIIVFDSTLRKITTNNIAETHYRASVYNCKYNDKCYRTFGYIVNDKYNYSKCDINGCIYMNYNEEKKELERNCVNAGSGNIIYDSDEDEIMLCKDINNAVKIKSETGKAYPIEINNNEAFPEVKTGISVLIGIDNNVSYINMNDGYVLIDSSNKIVEANTGNGKLLFCNSSERRCEKINNPEYGFYYSSFNDYPIKCIGNGCSIDKNINIVDKEGVDIENSKIGFAKKSNEIYNYVEYVNQKGFPGYSFSVIAKTTKYNSVIYKTDNYIVLIDKRLATPNETKELKELYQCNSLIGKCTKINQPIYDGWYVSGDTRYKAIKCANNECTIMADLSKQCSKEGDFIIKDNLYQFCLSTGATKITENVGNSFKLVKEKAFPNGKDYIVIYSNSVIGIGSITKGSSFKALTTCKNNPASTNSYCSDTSNTIIEENKYCIKDNKIYKSVLDENVKKCIQQFKESIEVHIFNGDVMVTDSNYDNNKPDIGSQMLYCNYGNCRVATGYYKIKNNNYYKCDYTGCVLQTGSSTTVGSMSSTGSLKLSTGNGSMSRGSYYYIDGSNDFPGAESYENILIEAGSDYFVIFKGNGYYLISSSNAMLIEDTEGNNSRKREINEVIEDNNDENDISVKTKRANTNALYLCNNITGNCKYQNNVTGYYINAYHLPAYNKAIIMCYEGTCNIGNDPEIKFGVGSCDKAVAGVIIRQKNTYNYKFCYNKNTNSNVEMKEKTPLKYYTMSLNKGDIFTGINLSQESIPDNTNVKIIVKTYSNYIEQFNIEGFILYGNNEILINEGDKGQLYYCKKDELYEGSNVKTVQCNEVTEIKDGWYFNNNLFIEDHYFYKCSDSNCSIVKAVEKKECTDSGSLIYNNNGFKLCITKNKQISIDSVYEQKIVMNVSNMNEFPGMNSNDNNIVVTINNESVRNMKMDSYIVAYTNSTLINKADINGILYKCTSGNCLKDIIPRNGWYIKSNEKGLPSELIKCSNKYCFIRKNVAEGFYDSANIKKPIIQCILPGKEIEGTFVQDENSNILCYEKDYIEGWYLNADISTSSDYPLIKCTKELGCNKSTAFYNGWYANNGYNNNYSFGTVSNATVYPYIQCVSSSSCDIYKEKINNKCEKGGQIILSSNNYKICKDNSNSIEFSKASESYQVLSISSGTDFPGASTGYIVVKVTKTEAVQLTSDNDKFYYKDSAIYKCSTASCEKIIGDGITILEELTRSLMTSGSCSNESCNWSVNNKEGNFFTDSSNKIVSSLEQTPEKLYRCKKNDINKLVCYDMKENHSYYPEGYFYNNEIKNAKKVNVNTLYKYNGIEWKALDTNVTNVSYEDIGRCTQYKQNICYISYNNEKAGTSENPTIEPGKLCVNENGKYYLAINEINTGIDNVNCIMMPTDNSINYYNVESSVYAIDKYSAYNKGEYKLINSLKTYTFKYNEYFNGIMKSDDDSVNDNTITCNDKQCKSEKSLMCSYDFQTGICKLNSGNPKPGQLCTSPLTRNIYLIKSNQGNCYKYEIGMSIDKEETEISDNNKIYHIIDGKMYKFIDGNTVEIPGEGVYILNNANLRVDIKTSKSIDISGEDIYKLYICTDNGCELRKSCNNGELFEYMYDGGEVYQCNPEDNTLKKVRNEGYFLNYAWKNLIECYKNGQNTIICEVKNNKNGMEGYYVDSGNEEMIIKCKREFGEFICINEKIVECSYDDKDETCTSEIDLLRNSYCYYSIEDKISGVIKKLVYVENYIRAGDIGSCVANDGNEYYYKYKKSKFLGHEEREDLIKFTKNKIVSIYEEKIGYYIISTETGKGLEVDTALNKSRMYQCEKQNCIEIRNPRNGNIYVNKASIERMAEYNKEEGWVIRRNRCEVKITNNSQCRLSSVINAGDIIYIVNGDSVEFYFSRNAVTDTKNPTTSNPKYENGYRSSNKKINSGYYQYIDHDKALYVYNENEQVFEIVSDEGYYIFKNDDKYDMIGYNSSVNVTTSGDNYYIYKNNGRLETEQISSDSLDEEGYYWNKADIKGLGVYIQHMEVPEKKIEDGSRRTKRDSDIITNKFKAVRNKCTSTRKNICVNTEEGHTINKGSACVVLEGENKGLYLATSFITSTSSTINCLKYDGGVVYHYLKDKHEFAGEDHVKTILRINENEIKPFKNDISDPTDTTRYDVGYYIFNNDKRMLNSTTANVGSGYECKRIVEYDENGEEKAGTERYECSPILNPNKYYYERETGYIMNYSGNKWSVDNEKGYFFYNKNYRGATIIKANGEEAEVPEEVIGSVNVYNTGKYINSMVTDKVIIVGYESEEGRSIIETDIIKCKVSTDGTCSAEGNAQLQKQTICYETSSKKLYIVDVNETDEDDDKKKTIIKCYSGSESNIKYYLINNVLYRLDGKSVQNMRNGYYVLNKNWQEFSSTYPETPYKLIYCDEYNCNVPADGLKIEVDVLINNAGTGNNHLLKYFPSVEKFMNAWKPGFYFLNEEGDININEEYTEYINRFVILENGHLLKNMRLEGKEYVAYDIIDKKKIEIEFNPRNVYINYAKENSFIRSYIDFDSPSLSYDSKKDIIKYDNTYNMSEDKNIFKYIGDEIFLLKPKILEALEKGIYAIKNDLPFKEKNWSSLSIDHEICYYTGSKCNSVMLNSYKKQKYMINNASENISIIEYNSDRDEWRSINNDGFYFFFEDMHSINKADRRVSKVIEIINGNGIDVTKDLKRNGHYLFEGMVIESNSDGWEDGERILNNVELEGKRQCKSYEPEETIENMEFCYNNEMGVCIVKENIISEESTMNNCIFNNEEKLHYYLINDGLYIINKQAYQRIDKSGVYVIDMFSNIFNSMVEDLANAYVCEKEKCVLDNNMKSEYYLNMANVNEDVPIIIYYDGKTGNWRKTTQDGYYYFNEKGYSVSKDDEVKYAYIVSESGNIIKNIINDSSEGRFISEGKPDTNILVRNDGKWNKAEEIPECKIDSATKKIITSAKLNPGDICLDNKNLVVIKSIITKNKRDEVVEDNEVNNEIINDVIEYEGFIGSNDSVIYYYNESSKTIEKVEKSHVSVVSNEGMVILDNEKSLPLESTEETECKAYKCSDGKCELAAVAELVENKLYINKISEEFPLVKYLGNEQWNVVDVRGYYFLNGKGEPVGNEDIVEDAIRIEVLSGKISQEDIKNKNNAGFYFNRASEKTIIVSNNNEYWLKGEAAHICNITEAIDTSGKNCKTLSENVIYPVGSYCYHPGEEVLYLLTGEASTVAEGSNCVTSEEGDNRYISTDKTGNVLNNVSLSSRLIEISENAIQTASPGYYVLDKDGNLITDNTNSEDDGEAIEVVLYECTNENCNIGNIVQDVKFLLNNGVYEFNSESKIVPIIDEGLYFFNEEGKACTKEDDEVKSIIRIVNKDNNIVVENIKLDSLPEGAYINEADVENVGIYNGKEWSIAIKNCEFKKETGSCSNDNIELNVGSFCAVNGVMHIIYEVNEEYDVKKCIPGVNEKPVYFNDKDNNLIVVKEKNVGYIKEEGYFAIESSNYQALVSEKPINSTFIHCQFGGECKEINPDNGRYLNKSPITYNIVEYPNGNLEKATTIEKNCKFIKNKCRNKDLEVGDVCIATDALYLVGENNKCMKADKSTISYQVVGGKLYMLTNDSVIQKVDGYFFVTREKRAISNKEDYKKAGTKGYSCSKMGECSLIDPDKIAYYKDYNSINGNKFNVVKYIPEDMRITKRQEENEQKQEENNEENIDEEENDEETNDDITATPTVEPEEEYYDDEEEDDNDEEFIDETKESGFENISEEGIIKLADGAYVKCELDNNNEVSCHEIEETGSMETINNELIICDKNDDGVVECSQAIEEGYYVLEGKLLECSPNDEHDKLECKDIKKEGYFIAAGGEGLYECKEKKEDGIIEDINEEIEELEEIEYVNAAAADENESLGTVESETDEPTGKDETTPVQDEKESIKKDVECKQIECIEGRPVTVKDEDGNEIEIYICKDEKWIGNEKECNSYIKEDGEYYSCDNEEKDKLDENKIEKPNKDHTSTEKDPDTKTTTTKLSSTAIPATTIPNSSTTVSIPIENTTESTTTSTTTSKSTNKSVSSKPSVITVTTDNPVTVSATTTTKSTDKTTTTTTTKPSDTNNNSGALSIFGNIKSNYFYLALFVFLYILFI